MKSGKCRIRFSLFLYKQSTMTAEDFFKDDRFAAQAGITLMEIKPGYGKVMMPITRTTPECRKYNARRSHLYISRFGFSCSC